MFAENWNIEVTLGHASSKNLCLCYCWNSKFSGWWSARPAKRSDARSPSCASRSWQPVRRIPSSQHPSTKTTELEELCYLGVPLPSRSWQKPHSDHPLVWGGPRPRDDTHLLNMPLLRIQSQSSQVQTNFKAKLLAWDRLDTFLLNISTINCTKMGFEDD